MKVVLVTNEKQLEAAFYIRKVVFVDEQHVPMEKEIDQYDEEAKHFLLYNHDSHPIGAGRLRIMENYAKVERICVLKKFRGSGAGREIMTFIENYAARHHTKVLKLNAQTQAIPFYESLGYHVTSTEFLDAGIPHHSMKKTLEVSAPVN